MFYFSKLKEFKVKYTHTFINFKENLRAYSEKHTIGLVFPSALPLLGVIALESKIFIEVKFTYGGKHKYNLQINWF